MMRQSSSRNQRAKGIRMKNIVQICLLAAVSFWLIYQLKHSYDKKRALDDRSSRKLNDVVDSQAEFIKLGRKDLPHTEGTVSGSEANNKEEESEEVEEEEDPELRREMEAVEREQLGDDDIDEQDHERDEEQEDQEIGNDEAEIGEDNANEEDKDNQVEQVQVLDNQEHEKGSSQEAREESYKKDDASSAVRRENQEAKTEGENGEQNEARAGNIKGEAVEREDTPNAKSGNPKDSNGSGVVAAVVGNDTISDNVKVTETSLGKKETKIQKELNSTILLASEDEEKLHVDLSEAVSSNQTTIAPTDLTKVDAMVNNSVLINSQDVRSNSVEDNKAVLEMGTPEDNRPILGGVAQEQADKSKETLEQGNLENHSTISLAANENEHNTPRELSGSSHQLFTEAEREGLIDLSTLLNI